MNNTNQGVGNPPTQRLNPARGTTPYPTKDAMPQPLKALLLDATAAAFQAGAGKITGDEGLEKRRDALTAIVRLVEFVQDARDKADYLCQIMPSGDHRTMAVACRASLDKAILFIDS